MNILVIDNRSKHTEKICSFLDSYMVIDFTKLSTISFVDFDGIILSGGGYIPVVGNDELFAEELELIRSCNIPVLGICLGFELICHAFSEELVFCDEKRHGEFEIRTVTNNPLFSSVFVSYQAHRWHVDSVEFLEVLAVSNHGVEAVKHPEKNLFGVQFHPEVSGPPVIENFLRLVRTFL